MDPILLQKYIHSLNVIKHIDSMGYTQADNFNDRPTQTIRPTILITDQNNRLNLDTHLGIPNYAGLH